MVGKALWNVNKLDRIEHELGQTNAEAEPYLGSVGVPDEAC